MAFELRPYQTKALEEVRAAYRAGTKRVLLVAPTGSGKSAMTRHMLGGTKMRTLFLVHRTELLEGSSHDLSRIPHELILPGKPTPYHGQIHLGMMQTVARRLADLPNYDWIISDEAHLAMCPTWQQILDHYRNAWHLGLSATPCRLDGKGLGMTFQKIVQGPTIAELTARGYLVPCRPFAPHNTLGKIKKNGADYNMADAAAQLDRASITGDVVQTYLKRAAGKPAVVFCCTVEHAEHVAQIFRAAGISAANVDSVGMNSAERKRRLAAFETGEITILTNVEILTTGWDCPQVECAIMLRPTESLALYLQMVGRILRICPRIGKTHAILLDHVGNIIKHGLPVAPREWTLDGTASGSLAGSSIRICNGCYAVYSPAPRCPECGVGFVSNAKPRAAAPKGKSGELVEIHTARAVVQVDFSDTTVKLASLLEHVKCEAHLKAIAKARGYDRRWLSRQMMFRRWKPGAGNRAAA